MNHTRGPWHTADLRQLGSRQGCDVGAADGSNIALVLRDTADRSDRETRANARLVAAAPELLNALQQTVQRGFSPEGLASATAAIAKATGITT